MKLEISSEFLQGGELNLWQIGPHKIPSFDFNYRGMRKLFSRQMIAIRENCNFFGGLMAEQNVRRNEYQHAH